MGRLCPDTERWNASCQGIATKGEQAPGQCVLAQQHAIDAIEQQAGHESSADAETPRLVDRPEHDGQGHQIGHARQVMPGHQVEQEGGQQADEHGTAADGATQRRGR
jgi:hypothetical protein